MTTKNPQNDSVFTDRINHELLEQSNALAKAKGIGLSSLVRMLLSDYIRNEAPKLLGVATQPQAKGKPMQDWEKALSPAQRAKMDSNFEADWG